MPTMLVVVVRTFEHNPKTNDPKVFKLGTSTTLGYPRSDIVLGSKVKLRVQQYGVSSHSMSAF